MESVILALFFLSFLGLILGLLKPSVVIKWGNEKLRTRKMVLIIFGSMIGASFLLLVLLEALAPKSEITCSFTREPEEFWPDEKATDLPIGNVELVKNFHLKTYDVFGSNAYEVNNSVNEKGPGIIKALNGIASAQTEIAGQWNREETSGVCTLTDAEVIIDIVLTLPGWVNKTAAPDQDQKMWDPYVKFLKNHEQGHINIALKAARGLQAELAKPRSALTCSELNNAMQELFDDVNQKVVEADTYYDNRTDHGHTQRPADFPFPCKWSEIKI